MVTAIDTNVISALLAGKDDIAQQARQRLADASKEGALCISPVVHAELCAGPRMAQARIDAFLQATRVEVDWLIAEDVWRLAGKAYAGYANRRRGQTDDPGPRRLLADFLVGAHATLQADRLLTFDQGTYRRAFPALRLS